MTLFLLLLSTALKAQVVMSSPYSLGNRTYMEGMIGTDGKSVYALEVKYSGEVDVDLFLRRFNRENLNVDFVRNITPPVEPGIRSMPFQIDVKNGQLYLFVIRTNARTGGTTWGFHPVDTEAKLGPFMAMDSLEGFLLEPENIHLVYREGSYFGLTLVPQPYAQGAEMRVVEFDVDANRVIRKDFNLPYLVTRLEVLDVNLTHGAVVALARRDKMFVGHLNDDLPMEKEYFVWKLFPDGRVEEVQVKVANHAILGASFQTHGEYVQLMGLVGRSVDAGATAMISLRLDSMLNVAYSSIKEFQEEDYKMFFQEGKENLQLENYKVRGQVGFKDGTSLMLCEREYDVVSKNHNTYTDITSYTTFHYFNSALLAAVDSTGEFKWVRRVPKIQVSSNDKGYLSSFLYGMEGDSLRLWFNDAEENRQLSNDQYSEFQPLNHYRRSFITQVSISSSGDVKRNAAMPQGTEERMLMRPSGSLIGNEGEVILFLEKGKNNRVARLRL